MIDNSRFRRNAAGGYVQRPVPPSRLVVPEVPTAPAAAPVAPQAQSAPIPTGPAPRLTPEQSGWQHPMARPGGLQALSSALTPQAPQPQLQTQPQAQAQPQPQFQAMPQPYTAPPAPLPKHVTTLKPVWQTPALPDNLRPPFTPKASAPTAAATSQASQSATQPAPQNVSIEIKLPEFKLPNLQAPTRAAKRVLAGAGQAAKAAAGNIPRQYPRKVVVSAIVVAVLLIGSGAGLKTKDVLAQRHAAAAAKAVTDKAKLAASSPAFSPITPTKDAATTSTKTQIAFDAVHNVYSFSDSFKGNNLVVSQQPIPAKFKSGSEAVSTIAASLSAKQSTPVDGGVAYIASDAKSGAQTVVFTKNDLLIFIQSPFRHDASDWKTYIDTFKT
ncbi:MAG: hypothetical protein JWM81_231 [Candidatus Saccharibacteria bacterium]|nr:hypothetical protein [Candidatus Saccharibacteria bacterium]